MTKRQPTDYAVLVDAGAGEGHQLLARVGGVSAYTPTQARRRAAHLAPVRQAAARSKAEVRVYAVPERSMNPGVVERITTTRVKEGQDE
jgi:hypothetical protein